MKCSVKDCETVLELDLSFQIKICRWCRREMQPSWDDDDWFDEFMNSIEEVDPYTSNKTDSEE